MAPLVDPLFWHGRSVLVTGHTGFKGAWLALWLASLGARVCGLTRGTPSSPSLYELACVGADLAEVRADMRDFDAVAAAIAGHEPEIVFHLAAQPFVRRSYREPRATFETNVMGTVNVLEAARTQGSVRAIVVVSSDGCYENRGDGRAFREGDPLGGHDPYSSSKGCAELVAGAYARSFFGAPGSPRVASARAGNVIGGGDWGEDRLLPAIMDAALAGRPVVVRQPAAVRPWQHVLNTLSGYLRLAQALHADAATQGGWNFGPDRGDARSVRWIAERVGELWPDGLAIELDPGPHPYEAPALELDSSKAHERLGWQPGWDLDETLEQVVAWYAALAAGEDMRAVTLAQIDAFRAVAA